jgi:putative spermidine/putrescine transport system permease protein
MRRPRLGLSPWNIFWLVLAAVYFLLPLYGTTEFSLETGPGKYGFNAYQAIFSQQDFHDTFVLSLEIAITTAILGLVLMVPTTYWINLRLRQLRPIMDFIAVLPFVVPPITLGVGILRLFTAASSQSSGVGNFFLGRPATWLLSGPQILALSYVILVLPFTYRSLDAGMRAIDLRTLTEAAQSLGAGWPTILFRVILPNLRAAILSAVFLTITLVMGEYTMASVLLFNTFPVWLYQIGNEQANQAAALAVISLALTWAALLAIVILGGRQGRRNAQIAGAR